MRRRAGTPRARAVTPYARKARPARPRGGPPAGAGNHVPRCRWIFPSTWS